MNITYYKKRLLCQGNSPHKCLIYIHLFMSHKTVLSCGKFGFRSSICWTSHIPRRMRHNWPPESNARCSSSRATNARMHQRSYQHSTSVTMYGWSPIPHHALHIRSDIQLAVCHARRVMCVRLHVSGSMLKIYGLGCTVQGLTFKV